MSEAELWEMFLESLSVATSIFNGALTVAFAYLATAYFVGRRLSAFQVVVVSFLYLFGSAILALSFIGMLSRALYFAVRLKEIDPDLFFLASPPYVITCVTLLVLSIPVSLFFMYQIRRSPKLGAGSA
jgi:hypothetical protein